jgi:hypothetical protein
MGLGSLCGWSEKYGNKWHCLWLHGCTRGDGREQKEAPAGPKPGGAVVFANAIKDMGGVSERPVVKGCNDVAVDRLHQACRFLASLGFPFPLRGYSDEEYRTRHHALITRGFRWHKFGIPEVRVALL